MEDFKSNTFSKLNIVIEQKVNSKAVPESFLSLLPGGEGAEQSEADEWIDFYTKF